MRVVINNKIRRDEAERISIIKKERIIKYTFEYVLCSSIGDIEKRETAKKNKLNYIVLWNVKDIDNLSLNH